MLDTITVVGLGVTGKSFFVYAQKFSAGLCIFPLQSSALLFCHTQNLDILLNNFNCLEQKDGDELERNLFELHRILTAFEWHFSEINDLNMKIIKVYKDKIDA